MMPRFETVPILLK